jgi:hypothetical protein
VNAAKLKQLMGAPSAEVAALVQRASAVDPLRAGFYRDWLARLEA